MTRIKICGLRTIEDIEVANRIRLDYVGFVFAGKKREVTEEQAKLLREALNPEIPAVGVFLNDSNERIIRMLNEGILDMAQLHGAESEQDILEIKEATGKPVIKAIKVTDPSDVVRWRDSKADFLLLDAGCGDGKTFDWSLIGTVGRPFFLAGGLNPSNLSQAVREILPYCVDLSSGVEFPGEYRKDPRLMEEVVKIVRNVG